MSEGFYEILGIPENADEAIIRKAYRQKARSLHPDINPSPDALHRFQQLQQAYSVLKDPESRARYDLGNYSSEPEEPYTPEPQPENSTDYKRAQAWNTFSKYDPEYGYVDTDYAHYSRSITIIGIITLLFATTFVIDFLFTNEAYNQAITSIKSKAVITQDKSDLGVIIIETANDSFEKNLEAEELQPGEQIDIKRSLIYGFLKFKRSSEPAFENARTSAIITYIMAIIVYIASLNAIMNKKRPERKFNSGIIAGFFSVMLLFFALFA